MNIEIKEYLNTKIAHHCLKLFENEHYTECAHSAMKQVELYLNEKCGIVNYIPATQTIKKMFSSGKGVRLKVPLGEAQQENAKILFDGAFKYYRNYTAHHQDNITKEIALRVMLIASELLDLLGACSLNLEELGGIEEIKNILKIKNNQKIEKLLNFVDGQQIIDDTYDGFFEDFSKNGFTDDQYNLLFELNLSYYEELPYEEDALYPPISIGYFRLTDIGRELLQAIKKKA